MRRLRLPVAALLAVSLLGACGGGAAPAASSAPAGGTEGSQAPAATAAAPAATGAGTGSSSGSTGGAINVGSAVGALADLSNYAFRIEMKSTGSSEFMLVPKEGSLVMEGTVILKPDPAADITMTTTDNAASAGVMGIRIVDGNSCVNLGGKDWMCSPVEDIAKEMEAYKPESMLGSFASMASGLSPKGDETKNGVATTHYSGEDASGSYLSMFGLPSGTLTTDVWVAKDGGYVVSQQITAKSNDGAFTMTMDLTKANDPSLKVEKPASLVELPSTNP